jgi:Mn2+/Fe2+ NRAMP family transporter
VAVPVVGVMMVVTAQRKIVGKFTIDGWLRWLGWVSPAPWRACVGGMVICRLA